MSNYITITELKSISVPVSEQETTISYGRNEDECEIYTSDNTVVTKLKKVWEANPSGYKCKVVYDTNKEIVGYFFYTLKKNITYRSGIKREVSEEQREKARERFSEYRKTQQ